MGSVFTKRGLTWAGGTVVGVLLLLQLVPYGRDHSNPPVTGTPQWDSPRTEALFGDACGACHSNLTTWPWDSNIAPFSWLIQLDVDDGREVLNVSEWDRPQGEVGEAAEVTLEGEMPPWQYKLLHPSARLSDAEKQELADGLTKTFSKSPPGSG